MATGSDVTMAVMDYATGEKLGQVDMPWMRADLYAQGKATQFQWPEGIAPAGEVCDTYGVSVAERLGIPATRTIWLD